MKENTLMKEHTVMNRENSTIRKLSFLGLISIVLFTLGVGCFSWFLFNLLVQPNYFNNHILSKYPIATANVSEVKEILPGDKNIERTLYPGDGDSIGSLSIPALKLLLPIIQGTGNNELKKGVGHFTQSVLPGEKDNCVLSAHNTNALFGRLGNLKIGDLLIVQTSTGTFTYMVKVTRIVNEDDKTVIVPTENAVLTMTTCYPFNIYDYTSERYIVSADLVEK